MLSFPSELFVEVHCSVMNGRYQVTKLLNIFFSRALTARISPSTPLVVTAANPGFCYSELRRDMPFPQSAVAGLAVKVLAYTTEEGSRQLVYASIGNKEDESKMRGAFVSGGTVREVSDFVLGVEGAKVQERIWVSLKLLRGYSTIISDTKWQTETIDYLSSVAPRVRNIVHDHLSEAAI